MTPQSILEDMTALERYAGAKFPTVFNMEMWQIARESVEAAVHFEFGEARPKSEHIEFADAMMDRGLFRLPFEAVLYTGGAIPKTGIVASCAIAEDNILERFSWFVVSPTTTRDGGTYSVPVMVATLEARDHETRAPVPLSRGTVEWKSMTTEEHHSRSTGRLWTEDDYAEGNQKALRMIMGATALMMSKDVDTRTEAAPTKLNKRREEQGRPLIRERRIVVIKPERRASYANAASDFAGHKTSPRMHWRRGHFRQLQSGTVIPVAPSIVNADASVRPMAKQYRVQQQAQG